MKIAVVAPRFPYPTTKGDKLRVFHAIRHLSRRHEITLVAASDEPLEPEHRAAVARYCARVEVVPIPRLQSLANVALFGAFTRAPLQTLFYRSAAMRRRVRAVLASDDFDVVHASLLRVLPYLWERTSPPVVVDLMDSMARSMDLRLPTATQPMRTVYALEAARLRRYERAACERFAQLFVVAENDRAAIGSQPNLSIVRACADLDDFVFRTEDRASDVVVMTGNQGYAPNVDAVGWFAREVWPRVRALRPVARFRIVGVRPAPATSALDGSNGIEVVGPVPDIAAELHAATLAVCPMRTGSGLQIKVLEAMATGTPLVATSFGNAGIGAEPGRDLAIADEPATFAREIERLFTEPGLRRARARDARAFVDREFGWAAGAAALERLYERAIAQPQAAPPGSHN